MLESLIACVLFTFIGMILGIPAALAAGLMVIVL